jgi:hypothetical protein
LTWHVIVSLLGKPDFELQGMGECEGLLAIPFPLKAGGVLRKGLYLRFVLTLDVGRAPRW